MSEASRQARVVPISPMGDRPEALAGLILSHVADGIAVVDSEHRIRWANPTFQNWCGCDPVGKDFFEALGAAPLAGEDCPFRSGRLQAAGKRRLDVHVTLLEEEPAELFVA